MREIGQLKTYCRPTATQPTLSSCLSAVNRCSSTQNICVGVEEHLQNNMNQGMFEMIWPQVLC